MSAEGQGESINITKLSLQQLDQFKNQLNQEVSVLQESLSSLKMVQQSFVSSETALEQLKGARPGSDILVPLTGSLYVPGRIVSSDKVLVDIGTGYFVHKPIEEAKKYFEKKVVFLTRQMEQLQPVLQQKVMIREDVMEVFQQKLQMQMAVQKAAASSSAATA